MPRKARKLSKTNIYHIMCRGINKNDIFLDDDDYLYFIDIMKRIKLSDKIFFYAYCLMKNHIHLLVEFKEFSISNIMKRINISYAFYFNKKYQRIGHLFQDRFKSEAVEDERYLLTVVRYIHNNPVKAEISDSPIQYKWSSYQDYRDGAHGLIDTSLILALFSNDIKSFIEFSLMNNKDTISDYKEAPNYMINTVKDAENYIKNYLNNHKMALIDLKIKENFNIRNNLIKELKKKSSLSNKSIGCFFGLNEITVRRILSKSDGS